MTNTIVTPWFMLAVAFIAGFLWGLCAYRPLTRFAERRAKARRDA